MTCKICGMGDEHGHPPWMYEEKKMTYIIAEAGINHNGDMSLALKLIDAAVEAKADAVKFQLFHVERLKQYQLNEVQMRTLKSYCDGKIEFLCTPFDRAAVDTLDKLVSTFKIGSGQANQDFLSYVSAKGKPMIISTGMSELSEIRHSVSDVEVPFTLLHCVSLYPTPPEKADLQRMLTMKRGFSCPIGYSDHTEGIDIALAAVALGAAVIEKHVTLDKSMQGPDHKASITPEELKALVKGVKRIEESLKET